MIFLFVPIVLDDRRRCALHILSLTLLADASNLVHLELISCIAAE